MSIFDDPLESNKVDFAETPNPAGEESFDMGAHREIFLGGAGTSEAKTPEFRPSYRLLEKQIRWQNRMNDNLRLGLGALTGAVVTGGAMELATNNPWMTLGFGAIGAMTGAVIRGVRDIGIRSSLELHEIEERHKFNQSNRKM